MVATLSDLVAYLQSPQSHPPIRIQVDSEWLPCPPELLCALVVNKGSTEDQISALLQGPVSAKELHKARLIVQMAACVPCVPCVDLDRLMHDAKYAIQVQETPNLVELIDSGFRHHILSLSLNTPGCRVVQKLIQLIENEDPHFIGVVFEELSGHIIECALDVNGNHVLQKLIDVFPSLAPGWIVNEMKEDHLVVKKLAMHCYGCRVIQRLMAAKCDPSTIEPILESLCSDPATIATLSDDVFGNYVMQHALEFGRSVDRDRIALCLASLDIVQLGCSKFASNVVEKAIRRGEPEGLSADCVMVTRLLINAMLLAVNEMEPGIITLMKDRYGNYVVRAVIGLSRSEFAPEVDIVKRIILDNAQVLKKYTFSWHLVERLDK